MCGIAGVLGECARDPAFLSRMAGAIAHRGPDDQGIWVDTDASLAFANRRLAIIDLSPAGHQPMLSADGRWALTFNGEIYNHQEIRAALDQSENIPGGGWRGHSDTETFLQAIAAWGIAETLDRSVGMFAFAAWDRQRHLLTLARDRFGEKPLYYGWAGSDFVFASELKALRVHPRFDATISRRALSLYTARGYVPAPLSIYKRVFKLQPGCMLEVGVHAARKPLVDPPVVDERGEGVLVTRYWSYRDVVRAGLADPLSDEEEALERLEHVLARAVQSQSVTDVPVGAFLSGGIDSSTIVALYQKYSNRPVRTFTIGFNEAAFNEAGYARSVAAHLGTQHHERIVTATEARDVIADLPQIYDEPFADSSQIPTYLVSRFAREQVKVALSGDAGDELFGGYNRYVITAQVWSKLTRVPLPLRRGASAALSRVEAQVWDRLGRLVRGESIQPYFGAKMRKSLSTIGAADSIDEVFTTFLDEWSAEGSPVLGASDATRLDQFDLQVGSEAPDEIRMMYCDATSYLPDDILCKVDRASMATSLEIHVPFLDHRVAQLAARIPVRNLIRGGNGKYILRKLLSQELPEKLFDRPKTGFGIPIGEWIKGPLRPWAEDLLDNRAMASEGWFDARRVQLRWQEHLAGRRDSTAAIWSILMFQAWLRHSPLRG